ncbi:MAG: beta-lactamase family protein [Acidobacteria bacterium]|nr:beta-lactamase family protein [Acidobacteriota bacterium]
METFMKLSSLRRWSALFLFICILSGAAPYGALAQSSAPFAAPYAVPLARIEQKVEERRKELGIPGMSLAIVKDDQVIYSKGLGYKDFEKKEAATADTQFAIGSSTKAFTALSVLMSADEGKFSLDDSPRKVLPYFKMRDADTDKNMTIRDLLTHSSGLNRTDLAMITGKLNREELIRVAGEAKPVAKLREKFGYQNLMYATAGEVVAVSQKQSWEAFIPARIFKPLGMTNSTMSMKEMAKVKDRSNGYNYNFDTKETIQLPYRDLDEVAPAGSINSSSNDMAKWLRFIINGGVVDGKRLVSEKGFEEWFKPQMKVDPSGSVNYALGWFVQKWNGMTVVQHGGNIDGFNALVALIPEKKIGFVMLTNVTASPLGSELMPIVWENILGDPQPASPVSDAAKEAGKYRFAQAGFDIDVEFKDGKLTAHVPGQPSYPLEPVGGRKYRMSGAPDGFFITFKEDELYLEQPHGNFTLPKVGTDKAKEAGSPTEAKELVGKWESVTSGLEVEIKEAGDKVTLNIEGQQPYTLTTREKDAFNMSPLPDTFWIKVKRGDDGKLTGFTSMQPQGNVEFKPAGPPTVSITADELYQKVIAASGGEANWRKLNSRLTEATIALENQGVTATAKTWAKAPNFSATETKMFAIGKEIATGWDYFDGTNAEQAYSFAPVEKLSGKRLEDTKLVSDFHSMLDWKAKYKNVTVKRSAKVGDEEAYVVEFEPENGTKFTEFYSTKTFLLLKRQGIITSSTSSVSIPYTVLYEDYRDIDGVKMPFRQINSSPSNGEIITTITKITHNVKIDDKLFAPRKVN